MDARNAATLATIVLVIPGLALSSLGAGFRTENFIVTARTAEFAKRVGEAAEHYRHELAVAWLGAPLPRWSQPCPIQVKDSPNLGAGGQTSFAFDAGRPFGWEMIVQGSQQRILDSVIPHEITHTIFATHFGRPLPRWADEGACSTVEDISERQKLQKLLIEFLMTEHGIAFNKMFAMREYPRDIMPLYAQGYSLTRFLIQQGGRQKFVQYVGDGMNSNNWTASTRTHYGYEDLAELQNAWVEWVKQGSPQIALPIAARPTPPPASPQPAAAMSLVSTRGAPAQTAPARKTPELVPVRYPQLATTPYTPGSTGRVAWALLSRASSPAVAPVPAIPTDRRQQVTRPQPIERPGQQVHQWSAGEATAGRY